MVEKTIDLTGTSANSIEDAVNLAISRAAVTIDSLHQAQIVDIRAIITDGVVSHWRVRVKVSFTIQDRLHE
ncbi:MAG: dodecin family protein [Candidatus Binatia bacterium]